MRSSSIAAFSRKFSKNHGPAVKNHGPAVVAGKPLDWDIPDLRKLLPNQPILAARRTDERGGKLRRLLRRQLRLILA
jgi:hypothetical protein